MLLTKSKAMADSLCGRKRRFPCFFWFLLLFAAGGLVLFIHQQDLSETAPHQGPAMKMRTTLRQSRETLSTQDREKGKSDNYQDFQTAEGILSSTIPPMQFPHFEKSGQVATPESLEQDAGLNRVSKRQRKLLKTTPPIYHNTNVVTSFSSSFTSSSSTALSSASVLSSSATGFISPERWKKLVNIVEARQRLMKEMCATYKSSISRTVTRLHVQNIFVEDKHKLLYCQVPKAGCSNWKRTLIVLAGKASDIQNLKHDTVHNGNHLKTLNHFDQKEATHRLKTYTKVMFVREPLERLVSAYRDKFENPNDYYHSMFGKPIISKYRANASEEALKTGNGVTFQEFAHYLLDVHRPVGMDIHWEQANQLCHPCLIDYDFIGKFENMEEESNFLLRLIGAPPNLRLPSFKDRNPADKKTSLSITHKYFSQVSKLERQRVYDFYYMDYLMFNYSKPFKDLY